MLPDLATGNRAAAQRLFLAVVVGRLEACRNGCANLVPQRFSGRSSVLRDGVPTRYALLSRVSVRAQCCAGVALGRGEPRGEETARRTPGGSRWIANGAIAAVESTPPDHVSDQSVLHDGDLRRPEARGISGVAN